MLNTQIEQLHRQMEQLTLEAGVGPKRYASLVRRLEHKKEDTLKRTLAFLQDVSKHEYFEVHRIWNLPTMTPEVWQNYVTIFDDTDFEELALLKKARKALKSRYAAFFQKKKKAK